MKLVSLVLYSLLRPFWTRWKYAIKMQVANDGQEKRENKNRQFSLYFQWFERLFTHKSSGNTSRFSLLTGWPLGEQKNRKSHAENKSVIFWKWQKNKSKIWYLSKFSVFRNGKIYTIFWHFIYTLFEVACQWGIYYLDIKIGKWGGNRMEIENAFNVQKLLICRPASTTPVPKWS